MTYRVCSSAGISTMTTSGHPPAPPPSSLGYRPNVAIVVVDSDGRVLACRRSDITDAWQLPQGGIDPGEDPETAMLRELEEEIGTAAVEVVGRLETPIRYEWPERLYERGYRGQEQHYFLVRMTPGALIDLSAAKTPEFDHFEWLPVSALLDRISGFKADAYRAAIEELINRYPGVIKER